MNLPGNEKFITTANNCIDDNAATRMRAKIHPPGAIIFPKIGGATATNKRRILTRGAAIDNNCLGIKLSSYLDEMALHHHLTCRFRRKLADICLFCPGLSNPQKSPVLREISHIIPRLPGSQIFPVTHRGARSTSPRPGVQVDPNGWRWAGTG